MRIPLSRMFLSFHPLRRLPIGTQLLPWLCRLPGRNKVKELRMIWLRNISVLHTHVPIEMGGSEEIVKPVQNLIH